MLLNATKWQGYSFYDFWVIKRKPREGGKLELTPPRLRLTVILHSLQRKKGKTLILFNL